MFHSYQSLRNGRTRDTLPACQKTARGAFGLAFWQALAPDGQEHVRRKAGAIAKETEPMSARHLALLKTIRSGNDAARQSLLLANRLRASGSTWERTNGDTVYDTDAIYANGFVTVRSVGSAEIGIASRIKALQGKEHVDEPALIRAIRGQRVSEKQLAGLMTILSHRVSCLTGGPGVGKTTCTKILCRYCQEVGLRAILLVSPTAMGAMRLSALTGLPGSTAHKALGYRGTSYEFDELNPRDEDIIIADEWSMGDVGLTLALLRAVRNGSRVIFVGDFEQLPSVGPGAVFRDLCHSIPTARLTEIFRTDKDGPIGLGCRAMLDGELMETMQLPGGQGWILKEREVTDTCIDIETEVITSCRLFGLEPHEVKIATFTKERRDTINRHMRMRFPAHVPIVNRENNYDYEIWNGQIGRLLPDRYVDFGNVRVKFNAEKMGLAYCVTIHGTQGDQCKSIVVPVEQKGECRLSRALAHVAGSRATDRTTFVGSMNSLRFAVEKEQEPRVTLLDKLILGTAGI